MLTDGTLALGFRLATLSVVTETDDSINALAAQLRTFLNAVPAGLQLQILRRCRPVDEAFFSAFLAAQKARNPLLREQRLKGARHLQELGLRRFDTYLFVSRPKALAAPTADRDLVSRLVQAVSGRRLAAEAAAQRHMDAITQLRQHVMMLTQALSAAGLALTALTDDEVVRLAFEMLNPGNPHVPELSDTRPPRELPENQRPLYRSLSLREQLVHCGASQSMDTLFLGHPMRPHRVLTLKAMPKTTEASVIRQANRIPFDHWLSVGISVPDSEAKFEEVDKRRKRAQAWARGEVSNIKADEQAAELEEVLRAMESRDQRVFNLSLNLLFAARDVVDLERRTVEAIKAFNDFFTPLAPARMIQLPSFISMLPGASHKAHHPRTVLTDNAAHFLPIYDASQGAPTPVWVASTRNAEPFSLDIRDPTSDAWTLNVFGRTGSGKSFTVLSLLTSSMLGQGSPVIIIDIGGAEQGSYYRLCQLLGGNFVDLSTDGRNAINPFLSPENLFTTDDGRPADLPNEGKLNFLRLVADLLCNDPGASRRTRVGERILREAIVETYARLGRSHTPIFSDLAITLAEHYRGEDEADREQARSYAKNLRAFLAGPAGRMLNQPSRVRITSDFVVFDLKGIEELGDIATAVLYCVNAYVWNMIARPGRKELAWVIYDETWRLMRHPTAAQLQEELYRTARKLRGGVVSVTQSFEDFLASPASKAVLAQTLTTLLLRHKDGHDLVAQHLRLNPVEQQLFKSLVTKKGFYSEILFKNDRLSSVVRFSPAPFDYWVNTTDPHDKQLESELLSRFGGDRLATLRHLVATYPNGASAGPASAESSPAPKVTHAH